MFFKRIKSTAKIILSATIVICVLVNITIRIASPELTETQIFWELKWVNAFTFLTIISYYFLEAKK